MALVSSATRLRERGFGRAATDPTREPGGGTSLRLVRPPSDRLPDAETPGRRRLIRLIGCLALLATVLYLTWRTVASLQGSTLWLAVPLLLLEVHALVSLAFFTHDLWDVDVRPDPDALPAGERADVEKLHVAVLIPTYNEPPAILVPTIAAALATRRPHETWVLDDGDRPWVRDVAESRGARYRARRDGRHAKAGNINDALPDVGADLVAVVDADHVVTEGFLEALVPYFADPRVALVQSPQDFYNDSSFEHAPRGRGRRFADQEMFYRAVLAGRNRWGAAFWCGTGALVRVAALQSVGGVATGSVTEDIQTSLRLHRRGWTTVHHNEVLAHGLAADGPEAFFTQRNRWGSGAMQVLQSDNPARGAGLTLHQRLSYLATLLGWFDSWRTIGYVVLPVATLLSGALPLAADWRAFLVAFGGCFVLQRIALRLLSRGRATLLHAMYFEFLRLPASFAATLHILGPGPSRFAVTPKAAAAERVRARPPLLLTGLATLSLCAAVWYVATLAGWTPTSYAVPWVAHGAAGWLLVNSALLLAARRRIQQIEFAGNRRGAWRFTTRLPVRVELPDGVQLPATLTDMSITGARLEYADHGEVLAEGASVTVHLPLGSAGGTRAVAAAATVRTIGAVAGSPERRWAGTVLHLTTVEQGLVALSLYGTVDHDPGTPQLTDTCADTDTLTHVSGGTPSLVGLGAPEVPTQRGPDHLGTVGTRAEQAVAGP